MFNMAGLPGVLWVLPDSYLDVPNKDYGGQYNQKRIVYLYFSGTSDSKWLSV